MEMKLDFGAFIDNLYYMGIGMLCIFAVIAVIILSVLVLDKVSDAVTSRAIQKEDNGQN